MIGRFLLLWCVVLLAGCTPATPKNSVTIHQIAEKNIQETFITFSQAQSIPVQEGSPITHRGYGVYITTGGYLLTVKHILPDDLSQLVLSDSTGKRLILKQLRIHPDLDLALLKIDKVTPSFLQLSQQDVFASFGRFLSGQKMITSEIIEKDVQHVLLVGQSATPGSSGSPVWDENHELIGLITSQTDQGLEIILITEDIQQRIDDLIK